jgi:DNA-binding CsgD family transcriptional regulator
VCPSNATEQDLIGLIYDAGLDSRLWPRVLDVLKSRFADSRGFLHVYDAPTQTTPTYLTFGMDSATEQAYARHFGHLHFYPAKDYFAEDSQVGSLCDARIAILEPDLVTAEFYNDWHLGIVLRKDSEGVGLLAIAPQDRDLRRKHAAIAKLLKALAPHLVRAVELNRRLAQAKLAGQAFGRSLDALGAAAFVLTQAGLIRHTNSSGEAMLGAADLLALKRDGVLTAASAASTPGLDAAIQAAASSGPGIGLPARLTSRRGDAACLAWAIGMRGRMEDGAGGRLALLDALDNQDAVLLLVTRTDRKTDIPTDLLRAAFALSAAEARLTSALVGGESLTDYASRMELSRNTTRNQIASIFSKTGTSRQAELVARVLAAVGPFAGGGESS